MKKFIVSDESINSYGFRVLTAGIRTDNFEKNPVGYFNHQCGDDWMTTSTPEYLGPIIRWTELSKEGKSMTGIPVFDMEDEVGAAIARKVENDFIRAASIGFRILKTSEDPADMLPGQKYPTVTECELVEISVVDIPSNSNAICCFDADMKRINLNDEKAVITALSAFKKHTPQPMKINLKAFPLIAKLLGHKTEEGAEQEVEVTIEALHRSEGEISRLSAENTTLNGTIQTLTADKKKAEDELATTKDAKLKAEQDLATANTEIENLKTQLSEKNAQGRTVSIEGDASGKKVELKLTGDAEFDAKIKQTVADNLAYQN